MNTVRDWKPAAALCALALQAACGGAKPPAAPPPVKVRTSLVAAAGELAEQAGTVQPRDTAVVAARLPGTVRAVRVNAGDTVRAGQPLLEIDAPGVADAARAAEAAHAEAAANLRRVAALAADRAATPAMLEQARAGEAAAAAALAQARGRLADARLTAPIAGRVLDRQVDEGAAVMPGQPLLRIAGGGGVRIAVEAAEAPARALRPGAPVRLVAGDGGEFAGAVERVFPAADPGSRTVTVWIEPKSGAWAPGAFVRVRWPAAGPSAAAPSGPPLAPAAALVERNGAVYLYAVADGRAQLRLVRAGARRGDAVEIVSGVSPGERVVLDPPADLRDGDAVAPEAGS